MAFKSFIKFLIDPFTILWLFWVFSLFAWLFKKHRLCKYLVLSTVVWFFAISTPLIPTLLMNSLESRYTPVQIKNLADKDTSYHILILGGGHGFDNRLPANSLLSRQALGRLSEGIRLHRQLPNSTLVLSGFSASGKTTQAEMLQQTAWLLGISEEATLLQNEPSNTYQEAKAYAASYGTNHPVIVVTSASHMPRAIKMFKAFGIDAFASPTNYRLKGSRRTRWIGLPALSNMENFSISTSEYVGIYWYNFKRF